MKFKWGEFKPDTTPYQDQTDAILVKRAEGRHAVFTIGLRTFQKRIRHKMGRANIQIYEQTETGAVFMGEYNFHSWTLEFVKDKCLSEDELKVFLVTERITNTI